jgi:Prealbumin-like fold domain/Galactose oxidase, central domain
MRAARSGACAASLPDGRILVTGGSDSAGALQSAEILDSSGLFNAVAGMSASRSGHSCTALADGRVLVAGGENKGGPITQAEIYSPADNRWSAAGEMAYARTGHTATALEDGRVVIAGGEGAGVVHDTLEVFDPASNSFHFVSAGTLSSPRKEHAAVLLQDGRVLIVGGSDGASALASTDLYNPATGAVEQGAKLATPRASASATALLNGNVVVAGGNDGKTDLATAEVYDSTSDKFAATGNMTAPRHGQLAFLLPYNNQVLLVGGDAAGSSAELFTPWRSAFRATGSLAEGRSQAVATPVGADGMFVVAGGKSSNRNLALETSSLYRFSTLKTDQPQYNAGAPIGITGSGWKAGDKVNLLVQESPKTHDDRTLTVTPDATGAFTTQYQETKNPSTRFYITATGSVNTAQASTSTNSAASLSQCADGSNLAPGTATACSWVSGNVNGSKATYFEGDSLPYQMSMTGLVTANHTYTLVVQWDTLQGSQHALDYITSFDRTVKMTPATAVAGTKAPTTYSTFAIPPDPTLTAANGFLGSTPNQGNLTLFGGTILSAGYTPIPTTGQTSMTITFTASSSNAVLAWGGHISTRLDWGIGSSAVAITGSPFHTRLVGLDGSGGNQDRALSSDAVTFPGSVTITKAANPSTSTPTFPFTASGPLSPTSFTLAGDGSSASSQVFSGLTNFSNYTVTEVLPISGWNFDSLACTVSGGLSATPPPSSTTNPAVTISLKEGDNVVCTYANHQLAATVNVIKHVINDNGGTKQAGDFTMSVAGGTPASFPGSETGTIVSVSPGATYTVTESGPAGYASGSTGICSGTAAAGVQNTCTFTNNDQQGTLIVKKVVVNGNGGTKKATDFTFQVNGGAPAAFIQDTDTLQGKNTLTLDAATYSITEPAVSGYTASYDNCTGVVLANGGTQTCTITNTDQTATLIVIKHVVNDNGGAKAASAFTMKVTGTKVSSASFPGSENGTTITLNAGSYGVDENADSGYAKTLGTDCSGTIANGETKTCTITNDDKPGSLTVIKHVINNNGGAKLAGAFTLNVTGGNVLPAASFAGSETGTTVTLNAGSYGVDENADSGYAKSLGANCSGTIANGESESCTITNDDITATLIVVKHVVNDNGGLLSASNFTMNVTGTNVSSSSFPGSEAGTTVTLNAGGYGVDETLVNGYDRTLGANCSGNIANGQTLTCTITNNDQAATLIVQKVCAPTTDTTTLFTVNVDASPFTSVACGAATTTTLNAGTHTVSETPLTGWNGALSAGWATPAMFAGDCAGGSVTIQNGETKTCFILNVNNNVCTPQFPPAVTLSPRSITGNTMQFPVRTKGPAPRTTTFPNRRK